LLAATLVALSLGGVAAAATGDPKKVILPDVQKRAVAVNVHRSDLPGAGWKSEAAPSGDSNPRCSYYNPDQSDLTENGDADSPGFSLASGARVSSTTSIFVSARQGRTAYARIVRPALPRCLAELFRTGTGHPEQVTVVASAAMPFPKLADRSNAYRIVADFAPQQGVAIRVYLDVVTLNHGKVDVAILFLGIGKSFGDAAERAIARKVAARASAVS
jgi:hypothetical protein